MHFDKFAKIVARMESDQDGEALTALRMATAELKRRGVNWEEVVSGFVAHRRRLREMQGYTESAWSRAYGSD